MRELEHREAVALMQWCKVSLGRYPELAMFYAIPNGGWRHLYTAAKLKAEGVKPGVPDYCLPVARGGFHGMYLELKAGKNTPTDEQKVWIANLTAQGYKAIVCHGWEAAADNLKAYLDP